MGFFRKKKEKKAEEAKEEAKPAETPEVDADGKPIKPDYLRASKVELDEVETAIDLKARAESRANILKMYEDKYHEKLEAPEFSAGLQYEYQLYEEGTYSTKRDLKDIEKAAKAGKEGEAKVEGAAPAEGETKVEGTKTTESGTKTEGTVETAPTKTEGTKEGTAAGTKPETAPKPEGEGMFDPEKKINWGRSGLMCIFLGKPLFPIFRLFQYKAKKFKPWMYALVLVDLGTIVEPISLILWRLWFRLGYEGVKFYKKYKAKQAEEEAKAKEARKAKKAAEKAKAGEKSGKAIKA
jgi:hypothetical protein